MAKTRARRRPPLEVWKFGGASLADAAAVRHAVSLVRAHRGPLVVVVSALAGVTDALLDGARRAVAGRPEAATAVAAAFRRRHAELARALVRGAGRKALIASADAQAREYQEIAHAMAALADLSARASDTLVARGERAASAVFAAALLGGRPARPARRLGELRRDRRAARRAPRPTSRRRGGWPRSCCKPLLKRGITPVVPGFIGRAPDGTVATLGRGGSDLTATLVARSLGAARVVLWKDVAGILTADPRAVPDARLLPQLAPARGGRGRLLRRQGAAPARADPPRRQQHRARRCAPSRTRSGRAPRSRCAARSPPTR